MTEMVFELHPPIMGETTGVFNYGGLMCIF